jgi:hypothetical protein
MVALAHVAVAQGRFDAKVFAGLNMCQIDGDGAGSYSHPGLRAGVGTSFVLGSDLQSPWRLEVELAYTQKGSRIQHNDGNISLQYVEMPVMLLYSMLENRLRIAAGVAPAVLVGAKVTFYGAEDPGQAAKYKRMDWMPLTLAVGYRFTEHIGAEIRYQNSLLSDSDGAGAYRIWRSNHGEFNRLVTLGVAYQF